MKILVIGGTGILGKEVVDIFKKTKGFDVYWTSRTGIGSSVLFNAINNDVDILIKRVSPDLVINATVVKRWRFRNYVKNALEMYIVNTRFPRTLSKLAVKHGFSLIHISTNAVFSGIKGDYRSKDFTFPISFYGFTKRLGESKNSRTMVIRTSFVQDRKIFKVESRENSANSSGHVGVISVFPKDRWSGVTSSILTNLILGIAQSPNFKHGLYHFVPIGSLSKLELMSWCNKTQGDGTQTILEKPRHWGRKQTLLSDLNESKQLWILAGFDHVPLISDVFISAEKAE
jgi:dTDP-4-dehydrorhamnose reductase